MNEFSKWNIDTNNLTDYKKEGWTEDYFVTTEKKDFGILVYNIDEWRMLSYAGILAVFSNSENPKIELNSGKTWVWFDNEKTFSFLDSSNCIACRKPAYDPNSNKGDFPFLLINLKDKKFGFIEFDSTSIYYGLEEIAQGEIKIIEVHPKDLENIKSSNKRTNEIINLSTVKWFDLNEFDKALEKYNSLPDRPKLRDELQQLIGIVETVKSKITDDTDVVWAGYDNPDKLREDIENDLKALKSGDLDKLDTFKTHFLPTATFQEVSISNGWGDELLLLAEEYDKLYEKLKKKNQHTTMAIPNKGFIAKLKSWFS